MTNLSTIQPNRGSTTRKNRLARGRGSGIGGTSGRGMNGQNSRTGQGKRYPTFEGGQTRLFMRTPKRRGFTAYKPEQFVIVNLDQLEMLAKAGHTTIDYAILYEKRIIRSKGALLKILGRGKITTAITVHTDAISTEAKKMIEKAGGTVHLDFALAASGATETVSAETPKEETVKKEVTPAKKAPKAKTEETTPTKKTATKKAPTKKAE